MAKLRFKITMSFDGYTAGPQQSKKNPLGIGGMRLHEWAFPLAAWRAMHGLEAGEVNQSTRVVEESLANLGATGHAHGGATHASPQQRVAQLDPRLAPLGAFTPRETMAQDRLQRFETSIGRASTPVGPR